jgi:hypothetical protein
MAWQRHRALSSLWPLRPALAVLGRSGRFWAAEAVTAVVGLGGAARLARSRPRSFDHATR